MGAGTSMGFAMASSFAVLTHTTGSVGPSQVPARGRRRKKLAQDAKLAEDHSNLAKSSQGHDALHQLHPFWQPILATHFGERTSAAARNG